MSTEQQQCLQHLDRLLALFAGTAPAASGDAGVALQQWRAAVAANPWPPELKRQLARAQAGCPFLHARAGTADHKSAVADFASFCRSLLDHWHPPLAVHLGPQDLQPWHPRDEAALPPALCRAALAVTGTASFQLRDVLDSLLLSHDWVPNETFCEFVYSVRLDTAATAGGAASIPFAPEALASAARALAQAWDGGSRWVVDTGREWMVLEAATLREHWAGLLSRHAGENVAFLRSDGHWLLTFHHHGALDLVRLRGSIRPAIHVA